MIAILSALLTIFLIWIAIIVIKSLYPTVTGYSSSIWIYAAVTPIILILIGWAGERIFKYTHSIGRRIAFFLLLALFIVWPILFFGFGQRSDEYYSSGWPYAFSMICILLALIITVILIVMMSIKDKMASFLLIIPALYLLICSVLNWQIAKESST